MGVVPQLVHRGPVHVQDVLVQSLESLIARQQTLHLPDQDCQPLGERGPDHLVQDLF